MRETAVKEASPDSRVRDGANAALEVRGLVTEFRTDRGRLRAVNDVSFRLERGRVLAVIGESGSGKSAMLRSILGIQPKSATVKGEILLNGRDLLRISPRERTAARGRDVSMVFQDPLTALDPVYTVERQLVETVRTHRKETKANARKRALELMELVQIPSPAERLRAYPYELSGGMRQRVVIAMALAGAPKVLLADEPTTALDVTVQARILELFRELQRNQDMDMVIVTHDLSVAASIADDLAVMYAGRIIETGPTGEILRAPAHPYTQGLLEANVRGGQRTRPRAIPGAPPSLAKLPPGCSFAPRCHVATVSCWQQQPQLVTIGLNRWSRCLHSTPGVPLPSRGDTDTLEPPHVA
jgi:oligopeptide/dipeptide ABC transporter ATP-binding protein